jgi:hypothetical protein
VFRQALQFSGAGEEGEEQEVGPSRTMRDRASKGSGLFPYLGMLLAQIKWTDLKDRMTLNQRVSGSSPERPTTTETLGEKGFRHHGLRLPNAFPIL